MNCLYLVIISLLFAAGCSLTFNLDQSTSDTLSTVLIIRKSNPSILIFPNKQTITLNYPKQHRLAKLKLDGADPVISFKDIDTSTQKQSKQEAKPKNKDKEEKQKPKEKLIPKEKQIPKQKQISKEKQNPTKPKPVEDKYPTLAGKYRVANPALFNLNKSPLIEIKGDHITYTICSKNTCEFTQQKGQIDIGSCTLVSQPECQAFSDLFYSDMQFLLQLQLIQQFKYNNRTYKFFDKYQQLRVELLKYN